MSSRASIWNMAVGHLMGTSDIQSTTPVDTTEKHYCNKFYDNARETLLQAHDWRFASIVVSLTQESGDPPGDWAYHYTYPTDAAQLREILDLRVANRPVVAGEGYYPELEGVQYRARPIAYEVYLNAAGDRRRIATDLESARARYTKRITTETLFPETFALALSYCLAHRIALPLTGNPEMKQDMKREYYQALSMAMTADSGDQQRDQNLDADWIRARG